MRVRIVVLGADGVLGRATLPRLTGHDVVGATHDPARLRTIRELGAEAVVCDVLDRTRLTTVLAAARPDIVANFVTALSAAGDDANNLVRREGGANAVAAAEAVGARRLVCESVAFPLDGDAAEAVARLEETARAFSGDAVILRFGRFWGPGTKYAQPPPRPSIRIDRAGAEAARLLVEAPAGIYVVA